MKQLVPAKCEKLLLLQRKKIF